VITVAVRWYLRYGLSYRDVEEELLGERGIEVDHVTVYRWIQGFTAAVRRCRPSAPACHRSPVVRGRGHVKIAGRWQYLYRAVDQYRQLIDVLLSEQRDTAAPAGSSPAP